MILFPLLFLNIFQVHSFQYFYTSIPPLYVSPPSRTILDTALDSNGFIWVLFNDSSISKFNTDFLHITDYPNPTLSTIISLKIYDSQAIESVIFLIYRLIRYL